MSKAAAVGLRVVHFQKPGLYSPDVVQHCEQVHLIDYQDVGLVTALARTLHEIEPFSHIFTQSEIGQLVVGHLNDVLGLPGNSYQTYRTLHDKFALRSLLNKEGIGPVDAAALTDAETLREFLARHGTAIVKPTMASGSLGVRAVGPGDDPAEVWAWTQTFGTGAFMVEERLCGVEVSVESFTLDGRHTMVAVTQKDTGGGVIELGHVTPPLLPAAETEPLNDFIARVLDVAGVIEGTCHSEVILTVDGPRLIESHNRLGGDSIPKLVELTTGVDMEALTFRSALPDGTAQVQGENLGAAAICFLTAPAGQVVAVEGIEEAKAVAGVAEVYVSAEPGGRVRPLVWSDDRCGHVIAEANNPADATRIARAAAASIRILTEPDAGESAMGMAEYLTEVEEELDPFTH
jgi:biotin carboxylase